jgi:hypothetical protein
LAGRIQAAFDSRKRRLANSGLVWGFTRVQRAGAHKHVSCGWRVGMEDWRDGCEPIDCRCEAPGRYHPITGAAAGVCVDALSYV